MNFLKHGDHSHGVHGWHQSAEQQELQEAYVQIPWEPTTFLQYCPRILYGNR